MAQSSTLNMEVICSWDTSVDFQLTTRCYIPEDRKVCNHCCESIKSYSTVIGVVVMETYPCLVVKSMAEGTRILTYFLKAVFHSLISVSLQAAVLYVTYLWTVVSYMIIERLVFWETLIKGVTLTRYLSDVRHHIALQDGICPESRFTVRPRANMSLNTLVITDMSSQLSRCPVWSAAVGFVAPEGTRFFAPSADKQQTFINLISNTFLLFT
jgi:hypothetical protein